jgi:PEP-CTERM motif
MLKKLAVVVALGGALTLAAKADTQTLDSSAATTNNSVALGLTNAGATQAIVGNAAWAAPLAGSSWISFTTTGDTSNSNFYTVPNGTAVTFEQKFTLNGTITSALLDVLADDTTSVVINGTPLYAPNLNGSYPTCSSIEIGCLTSTEGVFNTAQLLPYLINGVNTLDFTVYQKAGSSFGLDYAGAITTTDDRKVNTPEPGTMLMLGMGLSVLGLAATKLRS